MSVVAPGYSKDDGGAPRVSPVEAPPLPKPEDKTRSAYGLFCNGLEIARDGNFLGWRPAPDAPYKWHTYSEGHDIILSLADALRDPRFDISDQDRIGIYAKNCPNWTLVSLAASAACITAVPLYDTLGPSAVSYICNHADLKLIFCSDVNLEKLLESRKDVPSVGHIVVFGSRDVDSLDHLPDSLKDTVASDETLVTFGDVVKMGRAPDTRKPLAEPDLDFPNVIMYTSGTTGNPKGVVLQNKAYVQACAASQAFLKHHNMSLCQSDVLFSFLPLAHIFAQQTESNMYANGASIAYYQGEISLLMDDLALVQPTVFGAVPRIYARFQQKILEGVEKGSWLKQSLFSYAYASQLYNEQNLRPRSIIWDMLIFNKIRAMLLPRAKIVITGAAPMSSETNDFLKVALNVPVMQGFGMTETLGGVLCAAPHASVSGTCGGPVPGVEVKLVSVPEMEYFTTDKPCPRGELYIRSPSNTCGYLKNDEETRKLFPDGDGWLATGDIAQWNPDGAIRIIDRRKNLFKMAQGEYVSPETLEQEYSKAKLVLQIFVYGNSLEASLIGVVVPDIPASKQWAAQKGIPDTASLKEISEAPGFKEELLAQLLAIRKTSKFHGYETIRDVILETEDLNGLGQGFHVDNELLTPSFKMRRPQLTKKYSSAIEDAYARLKQ